MKKFCIMVLFLILAACNEKVGPQGLPGTPGPSGATGNAGANGHNAAVRLVPNDTNCPNGGSLLLAGTDLNDSGYLDQSEVTSSADICNGEDGADAPQPSFTPVIVITPCGPNSSSYKEALLGLSGGGIYSEIITNLSNNATIRNTMLPDGGYYDTDDSQCNFSVSSDSTGNRTVSWNGSTHNGSGPFSPGSASYISSSYDWSATYGPVGR